MFKIDLEPLAPRLLQNREIHLKYLKNTQEQADILQGIVKQAKTKQPLDNALDFACCPDYSLYLDFGCSKHMTGNRSQLINFVSKFLGTVRFRNDHIVRIMGYGDYQLGNAKAINTACYTQNCSLIRIRYNKTPYELIQAKKLDLSLFYVFGTLCYPTNDNDDLGKLDAKADIGIFVGYTLAKKAFRIYNKRIHKNIETIHVTFDELTTMTSEQFSSEPRLQCMTHATSSSGLVPNPVSQQTFLVAAAQRAIDLSDSLVSTSIDQDAPSTSIPSTQEQEHSPNISQEPKNFKQAMTEPSWIDAMQEEIYEFQRLQVWDIGVVSR
nr:hypothetical protein [Tanacetum cinerariifolium]